MPLRQASRWEMAIRVCLILLFAAGLGWSIRQPWGHGESGIVIFMVIGLLTTALQAWQREPFFPIRRDEDRKARVEQISREQDRLIRASHGAQPGELSVAAPSPSTGDVSLADPPGAVSIVAPRKQKTEQ